MESDSSEDYNNLDFDQNLESDDKSENIQMSSNFFTLRELSIQPQVFQKSIDKIKTRFLNSLLKGLSNREEEEVITNKETEYEKFKREVAEGKYKATKEQIEKLNLRPFFEPIGTIRVERLNRKVSSSFQNFSNEFSSEEAALIKEKATKKGIATYNNFLNHHHIQSFSNKKSPQEKDNQNDVSESFSNPQLVQSIRRLRYEIKVLNEKSKTLELHLQLLQKAKDDYDFRVNCAKKAIEWDQDMIDQYNEQLTERNVNNENLRD